jgi:ribonuclease D
MENPCIESTCLEFRTNSRAVRLRIVIARDPDDVDAWLERHPSNVLGLDIEWKPVFRRNQRPNRASLLQLSSGDEALLIQLFLVPVTPRLLGVLADANVVKVGVGIQADVDRLQSDWAVTVNGATDIGAGGLSLARVVYQATGVRLTKDKRISRSNWEQHVLSREQIVYAGLDAWAAGEAYVATSRLVCGQL